jgi:hypothetical protein
MHAPPFVTRKSFISSHPITLYSSYNLNTYISSSQKILIFLNKYKSFQISILEKDPKEKNAWNLGKFCLKRLATNHEFTLLLQFLESDTWPQNKRNCHKKVCLIIKTKETTSNFFPKICVMRQGRRGPCTWCTCIKLTLPFLWSLSGLTNKFSEFYWNLTDSVPTEF